MKIRYAAIFLALPLLCTTAQANSFLHYAGEFNFRTGEKQNNVTIAGLSAITFDAKKKIFSMLLTIAETIIKKEMPVFIH
ncbi:50S ribosomal protein L1 [Escherichia coli]|uniref:50S ribosomal protein L1 n=1 Tax=Escherichia coli TaxID=562 RepID=UPI001FF409E3|nr:50S ribosomal protein L1 [Escherichia coli]